MAARYWVGGSGTWDGSTTTNWSVSSGGSGGASAPTSVDDAIFDSASNATGYTVTIADGAVCADWTVAGPASGNVTFSGTAANSVYGSLLWPVSGMTNSFTGRTTFRATTTGHTITTNGVSIRAVTFDGVGGGWTLGSALSTSQNISSSIQVLRGTFDTSSSGNYSINTTGIDSGRADPTNVGIRQINLNGSSVTVTGTTITLGLINDPSLTFNAGTSTITVSGSSTRLFGGGKTFYNVSFTGTGTSVTLTIEGANTYNDLTITGSNTTGVKYVYFNGDQTINGTLTTQNTTAIRRLFFVSSAIALNGAISFLDRTQLTFTINAVSGLADVDFRDIKVQGTASPLTGTRIGDCGNNSGITFTTGATKYWNLAAGGNWSATGWALSSGGAVDVNNFPLAQDSIVIENTGLNTSATITINSAWNIPELNASTRSNAMTLASGTTTPVFYGDVTLSSSVTLTGTGLFTFAGTGVTQTITSAGKTFTQPIAINMPSSIFECADAFTQDASRAFTITAGTVEFAASATSTVGAFATSGTNQKFLQSTTAGTQATLSQASGAVNVSYLTIQDINATGGATFNAFSSNSNADAGNNTGWDFGVALSRAMSRTWARSGDRSYAR